MEALDSIRCRCNVLFIKLMKYFYSREIKKSRLSRSYVLGTLVVYMLSGFYTGIYVERLIFKMSCQMALYSHFLNTISFMFGSWALWTNSNPRCYKRASDLIVGAYFVHQDKISIFAKCECGPTIRTCLVTFIETVKFYVR